MGRKTKDARSLPAVAQEALRRKVVRAVLTGRRQKEIAKLFEVAEKTVCKWMKRYREGGVKRLKARKRGRPSGGGKLLPWQAVRIVKIIIKRYPEQVRLPYYLWIREAVVMLIKKKFGIHLSIWTIGRYLKQWGFTPQKPVRRAFEQNPKKIKRWLKEEYPTIRKKARREKAEIHWCDEMGLRSDCAVGRSYGLRGRTPVIPGTGQRFGCNMVSSITNRGKLRFMIFQKRFNDIVFLIFLKRLVKQMKRKVFLIADRHPVHRAKKVQAWLKAHRKQIKLFYLPPYSPELNPDEMLNNDVKSNAVGHYKPHTRKEMISNVRRHLYARQRNPKLVKKYFQEKHVRYAAI